jgi:hypothetical protein
MAKILHLLLDWEYPHWMMMAGAIWRSGLSALPFIETGTLRPIMSRRSPLRSFESSERQKD